MTKVQDAIRAALEKSSKSRYRIAKESGIQASQLCRLLQGERQLKVQTLEQIAEALGLEIVVRPKRRPGR